jgi:hypothetical protein
MLYATAKGRRRLFRSGDSYHPERQDGKILPNPADVPARYRDLIDWYNTKFKKGKSGPEGDPLLGLRGMWKGLWKDEKPDDYVRRLRQGWE